MAKQPKQWQHKRTVAEAQREKDVARVAELHCEGLTFREIGVRLNMHPRQAHRRYRQAIERYKDRAAEAHDDRVAAYRAKREFLFREAIAGYRRSQVEQERKRAKKRTGPPVVGKGGNVVEGGFTEEEVEVRKLIGDTRFLEVASKQLDALARLDAFDAPQKHELLGGPLDLFQLLLGAQKPMIVIDAEGVECVEEPKQIEGPGGNGEAE